MTRVSVPRLPSSIDAVGPRTERLKGAASTQRPSSAVMTLAVARLTMAPLTPRVSEEDVRSEEGQ